MADHADGLPPEVERELQELYQRMGAAGDAGEEPAQEDLMHMSQLMREHGLDRDPHENSQMHHHLLATAHEDRKQCAVELRDFLASLPAEVASMQPLQGVPAVEDAHREWTRDGEDVATLGATGELLVSRAIKPSDLWSNIHALGRFVQRLLHAEEHRGTPGYILPLREDGSRLLPAALLSSEIGLSLDIPPVTRVALLQWILQVLPHRPETFDGFIAEATPDGVVLRETSPPA